MTMSDSTSFEDFEDPVPESTGGRSRHRRSDAPGPSKRMLHKDIRQAFTHSWGRFISIVCLMALGSFALVGLMVTGPDMESTGKAFYSEHNLADVTVTSQYGLSDDDQNVIAATDGVRDVEFDYFKDTVIKGTDRSVRINSMPQKVSTYETVEGRQPSKSSEIALDEGLRDKYAVGSSITFTEKADIAGDTVLKRHKFTVVGFVRSSEAISQLSLGVSTAGSGQLNDYAIVSRDVFDSDVAMIARLTFDDTRGLDYWSDRYTDVVQRHVDTLTTRLKDQPDKRVTQIREDRRGDIDKAKQQVADARQQLADAEQQLADAKSQIDAGKATITQSEVDAVDQGSQALTQLSEGLAQIASANSQLTSAATQLDAASQKLSQGQTQLPGSWSQLADAKTQLDAARQQLDATKTVLDTVGKQLNDWQSTGITGPLYDQAKSQYDKALAQYNAAVDEYNAQLNAYTNGLQQWQDGSAALEQGSLEYQNNASAIAQAENQLANRQTELGQAVSQLSSQAGSGAQQLIEGQSQLQAAEEEYQSKLNEFNASKPEAERKISQAEDEIRLAEEKVDGLTVPAYSVDNRREGLSSDGYRIYIIIANIVDKLAKIFPVFLYLVAALVTFTTMGRMVDEERINSGTLRALGYTKTDVIKKFTIYGFVASTIGTIIGVTAGHTVLPLIVNHAYGAGFRMPRIALEFHPLVTLIAFLAAWVSAVVPSWLSASRELREEPAALLQPKPPAKGSKILLERITPLWNRMSFTYKVTARNLFRYKSRMFMTVFGVCGSVSLLVAGLGVQGSIDQISERQFGELIHYDLIVAENSDNNTQQSDEVREALKTKAVSSSKPVRYETLSKDGADGDKLDITLLATDDAYNLDTYMTLRDRRTGKSQVLTDDGAVISERLADTLNVKVGDSFTAEDEEGTRRTVKVTGISEMYIGHFVTMTSDGYAKTFHKDYDSNAFMVRLKNGDTDNAARQGARLMKLSGVKGVVQNISNKQMTDTIVTSLNQIMQVLVIIAVLLAVVILYNLTNLNVSERIRELSTIKVLGFHSNETTMYIYRETIVLSVLGILAGYGIGTGLHRYIITAVPPNEVMFDPAIVPHAFWVPVVVVALVLAVLGWVVYRRLKTVDMLEALKSVE